MTLPISLKAFLALTTCLYLFACEQHNKTLVPSEASIHTQKQQEALTRRLGLEQALEEHPDYLDATRGLIAQEGQILITGKEGQVVWNTADYDFITGEAPATVNPSLWRQEKLNNIHGLFEVSEGIYQLRGYDLSNMTLIRGESGWIVVDPLTAEETARHAFNFAMQHLENLPIKAVIYTHSHIDHFGGVQGIINDEDIAKHNIRIIAPKGFMEEATSENILVGLAMGRRATYMYGRNLDRSPLGHVGTGLGKSPAFGTFSLIAPNELIDHTGQTLTIDGLEFVFQFTPDSEAPAELVFYLPEKKALCVAELGLRSMHNLYTLRGAKVRDALKWSGYLQEASQLFPQTKVYFGSHHWPMWGNAQVMDFLAKQADGYKFIHDQSVRLINLGYTPNEIAESLELPESLAQTFANRGYYGSLKHNAKAIYQHYMGWYDANPANLDPLPPEEAAKKYIALMDGADAVLEAASKAYDEGEYRWVAQLLNHLVFAAPGNQAARQLLAKTHQQLAYQAESGPWRDVYLSAARELQLGPDQNKLEPKLMENVLRKTPSAYFLKAMAVNLDADKAEGEELLINLHFTDTDENFVIHIRNSVFNFRETDILDSADATLHMKRDFFIDLIVLGERDLSTLLSGDVRLEGEKLKVLKFLTLLTPPTSGFNIIEP